MILMTSKQHATKLVSYLNQKVTFYVISTSKYLPYNHPRDDIGVCYGYPYLINKEELSKRTWYNYHPAPLPEYGDWGNYARGLYDLQKGKLKNWGVSLHLIDKSVDTGKVLRVLDIPLMSIPCDIQELGDIGHYYLFQLFKQTIHALRLEPKTKKELDEIC